MREEGIEILLLPNNDEDKRVKKRMFPLVSPAAFSSGFAAVVYIISKQSPIIFLLYLLFDGK